MPLYWIPLVERFAIVGDNNSCRQVMTFNRIGVVVYSGEGILPTTKDIKCSSIGERETRCLVRADTPLEAIGIFYQEFEAARIGEPDSYCRALRIDYHNPILELPYCELLHQNTDGEFICGSPDGNGGEYGLCILENDTPIENCPIAHFFEVLRSQEKLPTHHVYGFPYVRACHLISRDHFRS